MHFSCRPFGDQGHLLPLVLVLKTQPRTIFHYQTGTTVSVKLVKKILLVHIRKEWNVILDINLSSEIIILIRRNLIKIIESLHISFYVILTWLVFVSI